MNDTSPVPSTRARLARPLRLLLVAGGCLLADTARGEGPPNRPVLNLVDGGVVPGVLEENGRPGLVRWKSEAFETAWDFHQNAIGSIRFPTAPKSPRAVGALGFELSGGDVLFGSIISLDEKVAELDVTRLGRLRVDRARLRRIFRWRDGASLVYDGPNGLDGWREFTPPKVPPARPARPGGIGFIFNGNLNAPAPVKAKPEVVPLGPGWLEDGSHLRAIKGGATIQANVGLPTRASIELELSWNRAPDFVLAIGVSDNEKTVDRAFRLEAWDDQLVALRETDTEADVVKLQSAPDGPGRARLRIFLDQELGRLLVFSEDGQPLADLKLGGPSGPTLPGIRLTNVHGDLRLERLRVGRWDGETRRLSTDKNPHIQLTDMSTIRGSVEQFDPASREFIVRGESGLSRVAEDRAEVVDLTPSDEALDALRPVRVVYQDGTQLRGEWTNVEGGRLTLAVPGIAEPLRLPTVGLRSVDVLRHDGKPRERDEMTGTLEVNGLRMLGRLANSGDRPGAGAGAVAWQPLGAETPSVIRPGVSGRIVYRNPPPRPVQPAQPRQQIANARAIANPLQPVLDRWMPPPISAGRRSLYLRTGDIIPVEVMKIDEDGLWFATDLSDSKFVPNARIKAVELATETESSVRVSKAKFERLLTLPRMQKSSPPTHLIRSKNGDMLRGRVIGMDDKTIHVEVRLEQKDVLRDRVSRMIWLHADETDPSKKVAGPPGNMPLMRVQAVRSDGIRLTFVAERFADGILSGTSEVLGACKVRPQELDQLLIGEAVEKEAAQLAYQNFKLQDAPEPKSAQADGGSSANGGGAGTESALVGKDAPDFRLDLLGGNKFHLAENKGKVIVLDFWATWCGPCLQAMPQIERVTREFADKGVQLIAVNLQETPAQISAMLERQKLSPTVALDRDGVVAEKYGANAIPQTVVIDREGKVTRLFIGGGPHLGDQLREALQQALMPVAKP